MDLSYGVSAGFAGGTTATGSAAPGVAVAETVCSVCSLMRMRWFASVRRHLAGAGTSPKMVVRGTRPQDTRLDVVTGTLVALPAGTGDCRTEQQEGIIARDHGSSVKNDKQYEGLRKKGMSKERAAKIANTPNASSKGGGKSGGGKSGGGKSGGRKSS